MPHQLTLINNGKGVARKSNCIGQPAAVPHRGIDFRHSLGLRAPIRHQVLDRQHAAVARAGSVLKQPEKARLWHRNRLFHGNGTGHLKVRYDALRYQSAFARLLALDRPPAVLLPGSRQDAASRQNVLGQRYFRGFGIWHIEDQTKRRLQDCAFSFY